MLKLSKLKLKILKANQASVNTKKAAKHEKQIQTINKVFLVCIQF